MSADQDQEMAVEPGSPTADLIVDLERVMPTQVPIGQSAAVFLLGSCFHRHAAIKELEIVVDGVPHRASAFGMPRPDLAGPAGRAAPDYRSGFWATVPIQARDRAGAVELQVAVRLAGGTRLTSALGRIDVVQADPAPTLAAGPKPGGDELIAICMAAFEPDMTLFRTQIDSLRAQTDGAWVCLISDDCSSIPRFEQMTGILGADPRFIVSRSATRLGFYRNFERAMRMAPIEAELVALCDQDDHWRPDKLQVLRASLGDAQLVYSDQRLTDAEGRVLRNTLWRGRRNNYRNLTSQLVANTITGAAMLMRRDLAQLALPFPEGPGFMFHDHWIGALAIANGRVAFVDRPLYDYVQHVGAVFGDVSSGPERPVRPRWRPRRPQLGSLRARVDRWRAAYFYGYVTREVQARTLLVRCSATLTARNRRALQRYVDSADSLAAFAWLALRPLRLALGLNETLGSEADLARGILWRWLIVICAAAPGAGRPRCDSSLPDPAIFEQRRLRRWRAQL